METQTVQIDAVSHGEGGSYTDENHLIKKILSENPETLETKWQVNKTQNDSHNYYSVSLSPGNYYAIFEAFDLGQSCDGYTSVSYYAPKYYQYGKNCLPPYEANISSYPISSTSEVFTTSSGPSVVGDNYYTYSVSLDNNGFVCYKRGNSSPVKITSSGQNTSPCITLDNSGNCYVAWNKGSQIYFQKIPSNFAPVAGTVTASAIKNTNKP